MPQVRKCIRDTSQPVLLSATNSFTPPWSSPLLSALDLGYILWGPVTQWNLPFDPLLPTILGFAPFFALGTWMGSRKHREVGKFK